MRRRSSWTGASPASASSAVFVRRRTEGNDARRASAATRPPAGARALRAQDGPALNPTGSAAYRRAGFTTYFPFGPRGSGGGTGATATVD